MKDKIFEFAYQEALNDAIQRLAYEGEKKKIAANSDVKNVVKNYVDNVLSGNNPDMLETAREVAGYINDNEFSFGNIQKLINMTIKYIFIACYACEEIREKFSSCHCPMDSIMMKKVREAYLEYNGNDKKMVKILAEKEGLMPIEYDYLVWGM